MPLRDINPANRDISHTVDFSTIQGQRINKSGKNGNKFTPLNRLPAGPFCRGFWSQPARYVQGAGNCTII